MPLKLILETSIFAIIMILVIISIVKRGRISVKYSLVWLFSMLIILLAAIIPNFMQIIATLLGFQTMSNMIFCILIASLIFICISLTIIVSGQKEKTRLLIQEISILKSKISKLESNNEKK